MNKLWIVICLQVTGILIANHLGAGRFLLDSDPTRLVWIIFSIWAIASAMVVWHEYCVDCNVDSGMISYLADACAGLGLVGTVIGFMLMMQGVEIGEVTSETLKQSLSGMLRGFGTAMTTTLIGTLASLSIRFQVEVAKS